MERKFRLQGKKFFLTYPACPTTWTLESVKMCIEEKTDYIENYVYAKEQHEDGTPHFHVYLSLTHRLDTQNPKFWDIMGRHGNYQIAIRYRQVILYCKKGKDFISNIPDEKLVLSKEEKNKQLFDLAIQHGTPYLLENGLISLKEYAWVNSGLELYKKQVVKDPREDLPDRLPNNWNKDLNVNLDIKKCHYWIWSTEPNKGKTTFLLELQRNYRVEGWNLFENFQSTISPSTEVIYFDEFRGQVKISLLNSLCDGTLQIPRKGLPSLKLDTKPLIIICGNIPPEKCYKEHLLEYIYARFNIIEL